MAKGKYQEWITEDGLALLGYWWKCGYTDEQVANSIGINVATLYDWQKKYPEISEAKRKSRVANAKAVEALQKIAFGDAVTVETTKELRKNPDTGLYEMMVVREKTTRMPPNVTALIFYLKNRDSDYWKDKPEPSQDETIKAAFELLGGIKDSLDGDDTER